jgi:hypothetical protein
MASVRRETTGVERLALVAALVPFVVAVVRAAVTDWMPIGDATYFTVRSVDVFTRHTPLLGAWSSGSAVVGVPVNNLGPLHLYLLAPFTWMTPYLGTAIGSALINAASIVIVWAVAVRMFRPAVVVAVMAGTLLFVATLGLSWLIDARQQYAMVIPLFALLWLSAGMWAGLGWAVPLAVVVASVTVQTHFTYAYQSVFVVAAGIAGYLIATRESREVWRRTAAWTLGAGVVCWIPPLIDQLWFSGNLGDALGPARGEPGAGISAGVQIVAGAALEPPFWLPGSIGSFLLPHDGISLPGAVATVVMWVVIGVAVTALGVRHGVLVTRAVGSASVAALIAGLVAATLIPVSMFGLVPQNYYWAWALGAFLTISLVAGVLSLPTVTARMTSPAGATRRVVLLGPLAAVLAVAVWPRYPVASVAQDEVEARRVGRPLRDELRDALDAGVVADVVEVDLSRAFFGNDYPYVLLAELQRAGIEFRFIPGSRNLDRFGESRCAEAGRYPRILIISGRDPDLAPDSTIVARVEAVTDAELDDYEALQTHFGDALRSGLLDVDPDDVDRIFGARSDDLRRVLGTEGMQAAGLARQLAIWRSWGIVDVPETEREAFDRWVDLEERAIHDFQTIVIENPVAGDRQPC